MTEVLDQKKASAGWYADKRWPGEQRRWDGAKWLDDWRPIESGAGPSVFLAFGLALVVGFAILTWIAFSLSDKAGWPTLWIGSAASSVMLSIGIIGKGVEIGVRAARR